EHEAAGPALREALGKIASFEPGTAGYERLQGALQEWTEQRFARYQKQFRPRTEALGWFVTDRRGLQVARAPLAKETINKNFAERDYFHGLGVDWKEKHKGPGPPPPIRQPHRSVVFRSKATNSLMVAFSVPVWSKDSQNTEPAGVLALTVELGK